MIHKPTTPKIYEPQDGSCVLNLDARDVRGSKIYDRSGKGNHGAISGAVLKPSNYGIPVLDFDLIDDNINIVDDDSLSFPGSFTILAVVRKNDYNVQGMIASKYGGDLKEYYFKVVDNKINFLTGNGVANVGVNNSLSLKNGKCYFVAGVYNGVDLRVFVNGKDDTSVVKNQTPSVPNALDITIGKASWYNELYFGGEIHEVKLINRNLSPLEISQYFNKIRHQYGI